MKRAAKVRTGKKRPLLQVALIGAATYLALFAMLFAGITPEQYDIQVGVPSPTLIKATKDIQDTVTTEALREAAANAVEPSYRSVDPTVLDQVMRDLNARFDALRALREELGAEEARALSEEELAAINDSLSMSLTREQIATLIETGEDTLESIFADADKLVQEILTATLPEGQETNAIRSIRDDLSGLYSGQLTSLVVEAVRGCLQPNMLIDEEITAANREAARESVEPVTYLKDQTIVSEGEVVTLAQYTMIASMGILSDNTLDLHLLGGVALLTLLALLSLGAFLLFDRRAVLLSAKQMLLLCLIMLLQVGWSLLLRLANGYLMPTTLGFLLVALLMDAPLAVFVNVVLSLLTALLAPTASAMFSIALMSMLSGPAIVLLFAKRPQRTATLLAGAIIAAVNFLVTISFGLFTSAEMDSVAVNALWAAGGGVASAILCVAFQPLLELLFNLATSSKLIELSNPNQPLLRRLLLEASGTYHHSIIVANLAEAGCTAIGANGLLARVGAYYHDIGKLKRPMYFKENQMGDNPHDRTDPRVSTAILTAHTRDGAQMAQKARIPAPVVDIIRQHHGDTPVLFFYDKAKKLYGDQVDISAFRYEGPRPQTREAAVVMLADTIEAATRALPNPDPEKIDALIRKLVRGKLNDGQLDSSNLTFNDLDKICSAFSTVLTGVFHERIEYPDVAIPPRSDRPAAEDAESKADEAVKSAAPEGEGSAAKPQAGAAGAQAAEPARPSPAKAAGAEARESSAALPAKPASAKAPASGIPAQPSMPAEGAAVSGGARAGEAVEGGASEPANARAANVSPAGVESGSAQTGPAARGENTSAPARAEALERAAAPGQPAQRTAPQAASAAPAVPAEDRLAGQEGAADAGASARSERSAQPTSAAREASGEQASAVREAAGVQPSGAREHAAAQTASARQGSAAQTASAKSGSAAQTMPAAREASGGQASAAREAAAGQASGAQTAPAREGAIAQAVSTAREASDASAAASGACEHAAVQTAFVARASSDGQVYTAREKGTEAAEKGTTAEKRESAAAEKPSTAPLTGRPCAPVREQPARGGGDDAH